MKTAVQNSVLFFLAFVVSSLPLRADGHQFELGRCSIITRNKVDLLFSGTLKEHRDGKGYFDVEYVHKGPKLARFAVSGVSRLSIGDKTLVWADDAGTSWSSHHCTTKVSRFVRYVFPDERDEDLLREKYGEKLLNILDEIKAACDAKWLELQVHPDGMIGVGSVGPKEAFECAYKKAMTFTVEPPADRYPFTFSVLDEGRQYLNANIHLKPSPNDLLEPLQRGGGFLTKYDREGRFVCLVSGPDGLGGWLLENGAKDESSWEVQIKKYSCAVFLRDGSYVTNERIDELGSGQVQILFQRLEPFAKEPPFSDPNLIPLRLGYAWQVNFGRVPPIVLEMIADAWVQNGDKQMAGLAYWRLASLEPHNAELWQKRSKAVYPDEDPLRDAIDNVLSNWRTFRSGFDQDLNEAGSIARHVAKTASEPRHKPTPIALWVLLIGGVIASTVFGLWMLRGKKK